MSAVPQIFDLRLSAQRLARAARLGPERFLLDHAATDLADRIAPVLRQFSDGLDFFSPLGAGATVLAARNPDANLTRLAAAASLAGAKGWIVADPETFDPGIARHDIVVSLLALQTFNDLPGALARLRRALKPDGLFIAALAGGETLKELRQALMDAEITVCGGASPHVGPFADVRALGQLLQRAGFALPVADSETLTVRYASPLDLMRDLRAMGATSVLVDRPRRPLRRAVLAHTLESYAARFSDPDGRIRATFEIVWLSGWAPHESQQKPLAPGSAKMRLAEALADIARQSGNKPEDIP